MKAKCLGRLTHNLKSNNLRCVYGNKFDFDYQENKLENNIYQEMSLTASAFAYTWSKWNADCGKDKIIIQAVEQLEDEQPLEVNKSSIRPYVAYGGTEN